MPTHLPQTLQIESISHLHLRTGWKLPEHSHAAFNEMILVLGGQIETRIRGQTLRGTVGSVLVYPLGVPHEECAVGGPLHLLHLVWTELLPSRLPDDWPLVSRDGRGRIRELLHWLHELHPSDRPTLSSLLHCALFEFTRGASLAPDDPISRVCGYINRNFARKLTLEDLAKIAHQSPYHFSRLFHKRTGMPPMRYLRQARVEAARSLMVASPMPLRAIASLVGLVDEFHLSRVFRAVTGQTPSSLRHRLEKFPAPRVAS